MNEGKSRAGAAFQAIRAIDYTVIFARDMAAMRRFYEGILGFPLLRELSPKWIEYRLGDNTLALATPSLTAADVPTPNGSASLQLAFKVSAPEVDRCADELVRQGVNLVSPPTDQVFGHRTLFSPQHRPHERALEFQEAPGVTVVSHGLLAFRIVGGGDAVDFISR